MKDPLADLVYAALLGEDRWQNFLDHLAKTLPDGKAGLLIHDTATKHGYALFSGVEEEGINKYNKYYAKKNPLQPPLALKTIGVGTYDDELFPRDDLVRTEFFNDFLVPYGLAHTAGVRIAKVGSHSFTLVTGCGSVGSKTVRQSITRLNALAPHLKRAVRFYHNEAQRHGSGALGAFRLMDRLNVGAIVTDGERWIKSISKAAHAMLKDPSPLRIASDGRLRFRKHAMQAAYQHMLNRNYDGPEAMDFYAFRTKVSLVHIPKGSEALYFEGPTVIILLEQFEAGAKPFDLQLVSGTFGLSKGEQRALSGILSGKSADQIAADAALSRETIRSQIKSLYAKTGAVSATDMLRLLHGHRCPLDAEADGIAEDYA